MSTADKWNVGVAIFFILLIGAVVLYHKLDSEFDKDDR